MEKSVKIGVWICAAFAGILLIGALMVPGTNNVYKDEVQNTLDYSAEDIWAVLVKLDGVEVIESDDNGPLKWRQNLRDGEFAIFERWRFDLNRNYVVKMVNSSFGMTGLFNYELIPYNAQSTLVKMSAETEIMSFLDRVKVGVFGMDLPLEESMEALEEVLDGMEGERAGE